MQVTAISKVLFVVILAATTVVILAATFRSLKMNEPSSQGRKSHYSKDLDQSQGFGVRLL